MSEFRLHILDRNLHISPEETITEIIVNVLEAKSWPKVESDSDHEEERSGKPIAIKIRPIDEYWNYLSTLI